MSYLKLYALTAVAFFAVDFVWLTRIAARFYEQHLGQLLRSEPVVAAAVGFYGLYIAGIVVFAVLPGLEAGSLARSAALGGFLGLVAYATFDLTCMALFAGFPWIVVAVDLVWGTVLTATVASAGFGIGRWLGMG
jgi:uncharacterized membrane protein